jgi:hypothetical protein
LKNLLLILFFIAHLNVTLGQVCTAPTSDNCASVIGGSSEFFMTTSENVDFEFDNMSKYARGITKSGATRLMLKIDELVTDQCQWALKMYIDNNNNTEGDDPETRWEPIIYYGNEDSGVMPTIDLLQVQVYNSCNTPDISGFQTFAERDVAIDIVPSLLPRNESGSCDGTSVNGPGNYLQDYHEYSFVVDYRIEPGFTHKAGAYQVTLRFCLYEVGP